MCSKRLAYIFNALVVIASTHSLARDAVTFASGAPLDEYQARVITPILTEAFSHHNLKFNVVYLPSLRALESANSGHVDGDLHRVSDLKEITLNSYPNLVKIDCKLLTVSLAIFVKHSIEVNSWDDVKNHTSAYYRGRKDVNRLLSSNIENTNTNSYKVKTDVQAFQMLLADRVEVVISESRVGLEIISSDIKFREIYELKQLQKSDIYAYIHKKHNKLVPQLLNTLKMMKKEGRFEEIIAQYN